MVKRLGSQLKESTEADEGLNWDSGHCHDEGELESRAIWKERATGNRGVQDALWGPDFLQGRSIYFLS